MKYLLGDAFTIAMLDDVLMSVDAGHSREVSHAESRISPYAVHLTTHDKTWLKQLTVDGLVENKKVIHFRAWNVNDGPSAWGNADVWSKIETDHSGLISNWHDDPRHVGPGFDGIVKQVLFGHAVRP